MEGKSIYRNRIFMRMFSAYSISTFGDWFDMLAIAVIFAFHHHASPILLSFIPVVYALPGMLLGSVAGVIADKTNKVNVMILSDFLSAALTFLLIFSNNVYWILFILMIRATTGLFYSPSQQALTKHVVSEANLMKATSLNGLVMQSAKVAGPLLGSIVIAAFSAKLCLIMNAFSFIMSGFILFSLQRKIDDSRNQTEKTHHTSFRDSWVGGWKVVYHNKVLLHTFILFAIVLLAIQFIDIQVATLLRDLFPNRSSIFGLILASSGIGAVVSIPVMNRFKTFRYGWAMGSSILFFSVGFFLLGLLQPTNSILLPLIAGMVLGIGNGVFFVTFQFMLQKESPKEVIGRVFGIQNSLASLILIIAPIIGGVLVQYFGVAEVFIFLAIVIGFIGILCFIFEKQIWYKETTSKPTSTDHPISKNVE